MIMKKNLSLKSCDTVSLSCRHFERRDFEYREERAAAAANVPHVRLHHGRHHSSQGGPYVHQ
jgi:hypothetical protein